MTINYLKSSDLLKAIGHPVRLQILQGLMKDECNVGKIVKSLGIPQSTVSQHLAILRTRKIIKSRKDGTKTCYSIVDDKIRKILTILKE